MWQETVFLIGGFLGAVILLPTLVQSESRVSRWSSLPTTGLLSAYTIAFYSLGMTMAAVGSVFGVVVWSGIAAFRS